MDDIVKCNLINNKEFAVWSSGSYKTRKDSLLDKHQEGTAHGHTRVHVDAHRDTQVHRERRRTHTCTCPCPDGHAGAYEWGLREAGVIGVCRRVWEDGPQVTPGGPVAVGRGEGHCRAQGRVTIWGGGH